MNKLLWIIAAILLATAGFALWKFSPTAPSFSEVLKIKDSLFAKGGEAKKKDEAKNGDDAKVPDGPDSGMPPANIAGDTAGPEDDFSIEIISKDSQVSGEGGGAGENP